MYFRILNFSNFMRITHYLYHILHDRLPGQKTILMYVNALATKFMKCTVNEISKDFKVFDST